MRWYVGGFLMLALSTVNYVVAPSDISVASFIAFMSAYGAGFVSALTNWSAT